MEVVAFRKVEDPEPQLPVPPGVTAVVPQSEVGLVDESEREFSTTGGEYL